MMVQYVLRFILVIIISLTMMAGCKDDPPVSPRPEITHPFLIVTENQFDGLREKMASEPWKSIALDAISRSGKTLKTESSNTQYAYRLQEYTGAAALASILDTEHTTTHAHRVRDAILNNYSKLELSEDNDWGGVVPPLGSFFVAILSLDIVYNELSPSDVEACEKVISEQIFKLRRDGPWTDARRGTHGTWDIYNGDRTEPDDAYYQGIMNQITPDGVSPVTNHYAWERVGGGDSRISKAGYMDVLEFTGIDRRYYHNERLQKFYRWLFGSSVNPAKEMAIFGDMLPTQEIRNDMLHRRVGNFDQEAAGYAAWFHQGVMAEGNILTYIIPKNPYPDPVVPQSQMYTNGGAFFREKPDNPDGLHAVLYNIMGQEEWHTHQEVNSLALSGYGNRLLVNGGRLGEPVQMAHLNNTLTVSSIGHAARIGGGITEGFTANEFDYACGFSGPALSNDEHYRSLILVHEADGANPYFILFDEIDGDPLEKIHNYLHPANESSLKIKTANQEYEAAIDHYPTKPGGKLSFFFATEPEAITIEKVPSAVPDRYPDYPDHNRLECIYPTDTAGDASIVTLLFPHNASHSKPDFSRITGDGYSGGKVLHGGGIVDLAIASGDGQEHWLENRNFQAKHVFIRESSQTLLAYFVKEGRKFSAGVMGFASDEPVSIYVRENEGVIISPGTELTLYGVGSPSFDPQVNVLSTSQDSIRIDIPAGTFRFQ